MLRMRIADMSKKQFIGYCVVANLVMLGVFFTMLCLKQTMCTGVITVGNNIFNALCFTLPVATFFDGYSAKFKRKDS